MDKSKFSEYQIFGILKRCEAENAQLKRLYAEKALAYDAMKHVLVTL